MRGSKSICVFSILMDMMEMNMTSHGLDKDIRFVHYYYLNFGREYRSGFGCIAYKPPCP